LDVEIPRDREGTFDPVLIAKGERRFPCLVAWHLAGRREFP
ncbi:transposase, partial [Burkholderia thailandensis]